MGRRRPALALAGPQGPPPLRAPADPGRPGRGRGGHPGGRGPARPRPATPRWSPAPPRPSSPRSRSTSPAPRPRPCACRPRRPPGRPGRPPRPPRGGQLLGHLVRTLRARVPPPRPDRRRPGDDRLAVVGVLTNDRPAEARSFVRRHAAYLAGRGRRQRRHGRRLGRGRPPHTWFVRPDGTLAPHQLGELTQATLDRQLAEILR